MLRMHWLQMFWLWKDTLEKLSPKQEVWHSITTLHQISIKVFCHPHKSSIQHEFSSQFPLPIPLIYPFSNHQCNSYWWESWAQTIDHSIPTLRFLHLLLCVKWRVSYQTQSTIHLHYPTALRTSQMLRIRFSSLEHPFSSKIMLSMITLLSVLRTKSQTAPILPKLILRFS